MNVIVENLVMRVVWGLIPVIICLGQFFITGAMLLIGVLNILNGYLDGLIFLCPGIFLCVIAILSAIYFWRRTFFDKSFVGLETTTMVQWSKDCIRFSGIYFDFEISPKDILCYGVPFGIAGEKTMFVISVKVKVGTSTKRLWLPITMPDKMKFLDFLESLKLSNEDGKPHKILRK